MRPLCRVCSATVHADGTLFCSVVCAAVGREAYEDELRAAALGDAAPCPGDMGLHAAIWNASELGLAEAPCATCAEHAQRSDDALDLFERTGSRKHLSLANAHDTLRAAHRATHAKTVRRPFADDVLHAAALVAASEASS